MKIELLFLPEHRATFDLLRIGRKTIETRAGNEVYLTIQPGDTIQFRCGDDTFTRIVSKVSRYKDFESLFRDYSPTVIHPGMTKEQLIEHYFSFPDYRERLVKFGILVFEFEP